MSETLKRELGLGGAVVTGLGSIIGTGAFVAIGVASGMWGDAVLVAIPLAALVAAFNGLSSAFLAGRYPVAGGTYEYGYRALNPWFGFTAGWLFLLAKTASAATAAIGISLYVGVDGTLVPVVVALGLTGLVASGLRRTTFVNLFLVGVAVVAIVWFGISGTNRPVVSTVATAPTALLQATAFLFVAYTGYGRIATLGEEVRDPKTVIPRAVVLTLAVAAALYMTIALGGRSSGGAFWGLGFDPTADTLFRTGAIAAMVGVLVNLILGLSRVWLAMGRRRDMPERLSVLNSRSQPISAALVAGIVVAALTFIGDVSTAWSFSAMTVLLYYGITNLAALSLDRRRPTAWLGLVSCVFLSFFVPLQIWAIGAGLIVAGLLWKTGYNRPR